MHDSRLEDQLRRALRAEGDGQSLTVTTNELERRLVLRRRARSSQRLSLVAAAVAVVAIGSIAAIGNGWLRMPTVGVDPSPSPTETPNSTHLTTEPTPVESVGPAATALPGIDPIAGTPGRTEVFRRDPEAPEGGSAAGTFSTAVSSRYPRLAVTVSCIGSGSLTIFHGQPSDVPAERLSLRCGEDIATRTSGWFSLLQDVRGTFLASGTVSFGILMETPAESEATTPSPAPRGEPTLGGPHDAVLVRSVVEGGTPMLAVTIAVSAGENRSNNLLTIPNGETVIDRDARVGPTGYLAIPRDSAGDERPTIYIYDLASRSGAPIQVEGGRTGISWALDGRLALLDDRVLTVIDPSTGAIISSTPVGYGIELATTDRGGPIWAADGSGLLAARSTDSAPEPGILRMDGSFLVGLPSVFAPTGTERLHDAEGRSLSLGCDASGAGTRVNTCAVLAGVFEGNQLILYQGNDIRDFRWTSSRDAIWLLLGDGGSERTERIRLLRGTLDAYVEVTATFITSSSLYEPAIWGVTADDERVAVAGGVDLGESPMTSLLDVATGGAYAISGTFAGWADQTEAVYPRPGG